MARMNELGRRARLLIGDELGIVHDADEPWTFRAHADLLSFNVHFFLFDE
jgi:hypothetical protein